MEGEGLEIDSLKTWSLFSLRLLPGVCIPQFEVHERTCMDSNQTTPASSHFLVRVSKKGNLLAQTSFGAKPHHRRLARCSA